MPCPDQGAATGSTLPPEAEHIREQIADLLMATYRLNQSQIVATVEGAPEDILAVLFEMIDDELVYTRRDPDCEPVYSANRL